jgi:hypothetical protein
MSSPEIMRIPMKPLLALILALVLPMRGIAPLTHCGALGFDSGTHQAQAEGGKAHCANGAATTHSRGGSDCCCLTAVASAPVRLDVPRGPAAQIAGRAAWLHPTLTIERLDRPPRLLATG